jgi:hypothetical protein
MYTCPFFASGLAVAEKVARSEKAVYYYAWRENLGEEKFPLFH